MTCKIMVVDDELMVERLFKLYFRHKIKTHEYEFIFAHNGVEAIEKIQTESGINMVLTDINMPEMDGFTLLAQLKKINLNIPLIVISAYNDQKNKLLAKQLGAFEFINKAIDFSYLEKTIKKALNS